MCELWVHKDCANMDDQTFSVLDMQHEETGQCFWSCKSCKTYALKFDRRMRAIEKRVDDLEKESGTMKTDVADVKKDIASLQTATEKLATDTVEKKSEMKAEFTTSVFEEMRERDSRRCNIIIHNLAEPSADVVDKNERIKRDKISVQELCAVVGADINVEEAARFARRLGPINRDDESPGPRPLLIGFKTESERDLILEKTPVLADKAEPWSNVNVIMDLTKCQRREEKEMRDNATKKNEELSEEDSKKLEMEGRRSERGKKD